MAESAIRLLPDVVANQIAAGEVVERPASVVKELVENSLDAAAGRIDIEISGGGSKRMQVRDDGSGMSAEDVLMAVRRHATSKIRDIADLDRIASMGFRGEALPSVAAVSRLCISSRRSQDEPAVMLQVDGGKVHPPQQTSHPVGTTVEVRDLFYNVPARRKFMRTERTESMRIDDVVRRLALASCGTSFRLRHEGGNDKTWAAATLQQRVRDVVGNSVMQKLVPIEAEQSDMRLSGWISGRGQGLRQAAERQFTFVNGRSLRDRQLTMAIRKGCEEYFAGGLQPAWVLFLQLDPLAVDVNAHPAKSEVRLRHARDVFDFIGATLRGTYGGSKSMFSLPGNVSAPTPRYPAGTELRQSMQGLRALAAPSGAAAAPGLGPRLPPPPTGGASLPGGVVRPESATSAAPSQAHDLPHDVIAGRYIALPDNKELLLLDMVAARASILRSLLRGDAKVEARPLLIPELQQADERTIAAAERHGTAFERMGLLLEQAGPGALSLRSVPVACGDLDEKSFFQALLAALRQLDGGSKGLDEGRLIDMVVDNAVANSYPAPSTLQQILQDLKSLPRNCWRRLRAEDLKKILQGS